MRAVFVNQCHPATPHVCATRLREFAKVLARQGHQVVLLTEPLPGKPGSSPDDLARLDGHDWRQPFHIVTAPASAPLLTAAREGRLAGPLRKAVIAGTYCLRGGVRTDWRDGSRAFRSPLARLFRPEVVWGTFGNTDAWAISQGIAKASGCPWVMDVKDPWSTFIPPLLRNRLARRFADAAAATALSRQHADDTRLYFGVDTTVLYSGIDAHFLAEPVPAPERDEDVFTLVGGVYDGRGLAELVEGLRTWLRNGPGPKRIALAYAGADRAAVAAACAPLEGLCRLDLADFLPLDELRARLTASRLVLYVRSTSSLFQHKLFELLAMGRPILCLPGESAEARDIVAAAGGVLHDCADAADVPAALDRALSDLPPRVDRSVLAGYGWEAQGDILAGVLDRARTRWIG